MKSIQLDLYDTELFFQRIGINDLYDIDEYDPILESRFELELSYYEDKFDYCPQNNYSKDITAYNHHLKVNSIGELTISRIKSDSYEDYETLF